MDWQNLVFTVYDDLYHCVMSKTNIANTSKATNSTQEQTLFTITTDLCLPLIAKKHTCFSKSELHFPQPPLKIIPHDFLL